MNAKILAIWSSPSEVKSTDNFCLFLLAKSNPSFINNDFMYHSQENASKVFIEASA